MQTVPVKEYVGLLSSELLSTEFALSVQVLADEILRCWRMNKRIFVAGNGGSSATAAHFVNDLRKFIPGGLSAFCLSDNVPYMTAVANDNPVGYDAVFRESLVLDAEEGDLFVAISTSGASPNIISAMDTAAAIKMRTLLLVGRQNDMGWLPPNTNHILTRHPDIRGQEDLHSVLCHLAVGEVKRAMLENASE